MKVNRSQAMLLAGFMVVLVVASAAFVRSQTMPRGDRGATQDLRPPAVTTGAAVRQTGENASRDARRPLPSEARDIDLAAFLSESPEDYRVIAERNLFRPLVRPEPEVAPSRLAPVDLSAIREPVMVEVEPVSPPAEPVSLPPPPAPPAIPPSEPPAPAAEVPIDKVAATGFVQKEGEWTVLLENLQTKQTRFAYQGETHWSYRVESIDPTRREVVLSHGNDRHPLRIGQNKQPQEIKPPASQGGPAGQGGRGQQQAPGGPPGFGGPGGFPGPGGFGGPPMGMWNTGGQFGGQGPQGMGQFGGRRMRGGGGGRGSAMVVGGSG